MRRVFTLAAASALVAPFDMASAEQPYYEGKQMRLIVSSAAGGGYDAYGRLLAAHMGRFLPGNPDFIVQNMPGGGGLVAANYLYNIAPKDGTVIANVQRNVPFVEILGQPGPQFEATKFNWIGSLNNEVTICVAHKRAKAKSIADLRNQELIIGGSGPNDTETVPAILNNLLGMNFRIVSGYPSSTAITLAVERGEVDGLCSSYSSLSTRNAHWFKNDLINILVQTSTRKHPKLPHVPLALELARNADERQLLELNDARLEIGRPFVAPPGLVAVRVADLRNAFDRMVDDKLFLADAQKEKKEITAVSGIDVQALIKRVAKTPKALIAKLDDAQHYKGERAMAQVALKILNGKITALGNHNRSITIKSNGLEPFEAQISGSRTSIQIAGKQANRNDLEVGMSCEVSAPATGEEAQKITCK